jgi:hypothetical protein
MTYNEIKLTEGQIKQLFNDPGIQGKIKEYKPDRLRAHQEWSEWLNKESLERLSDDELKDKFLKYYNSGAGRHAFNPIYRDRIISDVKKFREMLKFLLDESIDIKQRINEILEINGKYRIEGVGKALATSFLFDFNPDKYCIWNNRVEQGLEKIGWKPQLKGKMGEKYSQILETLEKLKSLAPEPYNNFNDIDTFLHIIVAEPEGENALRRIIEEAKIAEQFEISEETLQELLERNLTKLLPGFSIYEDEESWLVTEELLNIFKERMKEEISENRVEKIKAIIKDYISILLLYLGSKGLTKGQILSSIKVIVNENKDLNLSHYELEDKFYKMVNEVSSLAGCISKFNEVGGPESKPFIIFNYNDLDKVIKNYIEELGSKTISSFMS